MQLLLRLLLLLFGQFLFSAGMARVFMLPLSRTIELGKALLHLLRYAMVFRATIGRLT